MDRRKFLAIGFSVLATLLVCFSAMAAVPNLINYQGYLTDAVGNPLDGVVDMTFKIYNAASGGTVLWTETQLDVEVVNGIYNVQIGSVVGLPYNIFDGERYLGVAVETDPEMIPRQKITSSAFAIKSQDTITFGGLPIGSFVQQGAPNSISSVMIQDGAIAAADIGADAVSASAIAADAVGASEIEANAVGSSEVADNSLTAADLAPDSVGNSELAPNSVGSAEIIDGAVTAADMQNGAALAEILDNDGPGSGLNADYLDNLSSGAFMSSTADNWVNETGDTMTGALNMTTIGTSINIDANPAATTVYGLRVKADQSAANNYSVYGLYSDTDSETSSASIYGTYSNARKNAGTGSVFGAYDYAYHNGTGGAAYGTYSYAFGSDTGDALGISSYAYKLSTDTGGAAYGGRFTADNDSSGTSFGIYSEATGTGGTSIGVRAIASGGAYNYALYGSASGGTKSWAGYFYGQLGVDRYGTGTDLQSIILNPDTYALQMYDSAGAETVMLQGSQVAGTGAYLRLREADGTTTFELDAESGTNGGPYMYMRNNNGGLTVYVDGDSSDAGYLALYNADGAATIRFYGDYSGDGRIITQELQITGGSDLSEQFDVNPNQTEVSPGMVVSIDPDKPGQLRVSSGAYDKKVAGIISGANGVKPGMLMGQRGTEADGAYPVALSGRVYCLADTAGGPIEPGDLLTTSITPGHVMRATDREKAFGATIGKAMTPLDDGKGLILVLVSLQ